MKSQPLQSGNKSIVFAQGPSRWWLGTGLGLAAVAAIAFAIYFEARPAATPPVAHSAPNSAAQTVPDAAAQGVNGYLAAHGVGQIETAPDAARRAARDAARANGAEPAIRAQTAQEANVQSVNDYLRAHGVGLASEAQTAPEANVQSVTDYLRAHGVGAAYKARPVFDPANVPNTHDDPSYHSPQPVIRAQTGPDANVQSVLDYLRAHGADVPQP